MCAAAADRPTPSINGHLLGDDLTELQTWSLKLRTALQDMPEVTDVDTDLQPGGLEADLIVDRDTRLAAGAHGESDRQRAG